MQIQEDAGHVGWKFDGESVPAVGAVYVNLISLERGHALRNERTGSDFTRRTGNRGWRRGRGLPDNPTK